MTKWFTILTLILNSAPTFAESISYRDSRVLSTNDYLLRENGERRDKLFKDYKIVDLSVDVGIGTDCGSVDIRSSLKSTLQNLVDGQYFQDVGTQLVASSPMLLTCWQFPAVCSLLKNFQLNSSLLSQMNLSKCALVDKYIDSRAQDWELSRQNCLRQALKDSGGNLEVANKRCNQDTFTRKLENWAGKANGASVDMNKLIESSAVWAGMTGKDAERVIDLTKAFVGDTEVFKGKVSVNYGSHGKALSPRSYKMEKQEEITLAIRDVIRKADAYGAETQSFDQIVTDDDLFKISGGSQEVLVDRASVRSIFLLPYVKRDGAIRKLASSVALQNLAVDANRSLDLLQVISQNPNLPPHRKAEIDQKKKDLKDDLELAVMLDKQKNEPINDTMARINEEGEVYQTQRADNNMSSSAAKLKYDSLKESYLDCSDGFMCEEGD